MAYREGQLLALSGDAQGAIKRLRFAAELGFVCLRCYGHSSLEGLGDHSELVAIRASGKGASDPRDATR